MNDLREMLDEFKHKYISVNENGTSAFVHSDNELIYKILDEMVNHIENIERQVKKED